MHAVPRRYLPHRSRRCSPVSSRTSPRYEELAVDAAIRGGRERIFKTLLAHPLVGQIDLANGLTDRLLAANHEYLPWADASR